MPTFSWMSWLVAACFAETAVGASGPLLARIFGKPLVKISRLPVRESRPGMLIDLPLVMEGHFGFDPWEDLHSNMDRVLKHSAKVSRNSPPATREAASSFDEPMLFGSPFLGRGTPLIVSGPPWAPMMPMGIEAQLGSLLQAFGDDHAGHIGHTDGSFHVEDDHRARFRVTAMLPGYKLRDNNEKKSESSAEEKDPLSVRILGHRSLVVSGIHQMGPITKSWQRSFALPKGCETKKVAVTYNANSGNLTVDIPRSDSTDGEGESDADADDVADVFLPPPLRAMRSGLPGIIDQLLNPPDRSPVSGGFLGNRDEPEDLFENLFQSSESYTRGFMCLMAILFLRMLK